MNFADAIKKGAITKMESVDENKDMETAWAELGAKAMAKAQHEFSDLFDEEPMLILVYGIFGAAISKSLYKEIFGEEEK